MSLSSPVSSLWSQEEQMRQKDSRARLTSCIFRNMRTVKCHGWEGAFLDRILRIRGQELGALRTSGLLFSVSLVSFQVSTFLVTSPWSPCRVWTWEGSAAGVGDELGRASESWRLSLQTTLPTQTRLPAFCSHSGSLLPAG